MIKFPTLIALQGKPEHGKGAVATYLIEKYGFVRHKLAAPIKNMLRAGFGLTDDHIEGHLKEVPCDELGGRTPRYAMQTLGKEWRDLMHPNLLLIAWKATLPDAECIVVDDNRYPQEVEALRELGAQFIKVHRPGMDDTDLHPAENQDLEHDVLIINDGTIDDLCDKVDSVLEWLYMKT